MNRRCLYCGMRLDTKPIQAVIDGEKMYFCSQRCASIFRALGPAGKVRARIQSERFEILDKLGSERGSRVLTLVHRREPWSEERSGGISIEDFEALVAQIRRTPAKTPIDLIVHTPGGIALAAEMIAMAVRNHPAKVTVIVPFYAMSGGTLIALAADEILMEKDSILGPLDPQIDGLPSRPLIELPTRKPIAAVSDQMLILAEIAQRSVHQIREFVKWLLDEKLPPQEQEAVAAFLTGGYVSHDTPIVPGVLRELGLKIKEGVPSEVYELFRTYEFGSCNRPQHASYLR